MKRKSHHVILWGEWIGSFALINLVPGKVTAVREIEDTCIASSVTLDNGDIYTRKARTLKGLQSQEWIKQPKPKP